MADCKECKGKGITSKGFVCGGCNGAGYEPKKPPEAITINSKVCRTCSYGSKSKGKHIICHFGKTASFKDVGSRRLPDDTCNNYKSIFER